MIERIHDPKEGELLYHYCSPETFLAICTGKKLRFSDLNLMNDSHEMQWGYSIWELAASEIYEITGKEFLDDIDEAFSMAGYRAIVLASCLSKKGDLLSQWRAYANDGRGYSIGFDAKALSQMPSTPLEILYEKNKQIELIRDSIAAIHFMETVSNHSRGDEFKDRCLKLYLYMAALKNPAFHEESEVRLIRALDVLPSNSYVKLVDPGGTSFGKELPPAPISFYMTENGPCAYSDQDYTNAQTINPIKEVIIGPKNSAGTSGISVFLETVGLASVKVLKSQIPYR
jgi:hypothetical protein